MDRDRVASAILLAVALVAGGCATGPTGSTSVPTGVPTGTPNSPLASPTPSGSTASASAPSASTTVPIPPAAPCPEPGSTPGPDPSKVPDPSAAAGTVAATIPAPDGPWAALVEDGSVWVEAHRGMEIYRIDPATATVTATVQADASGQFDHDGALSPGLGGPWVAPDSDATRVHLWVHIDAATNMASTPAGLQHALSTVGLGANAVAETADGLWAVAPDTGSFDVVLFDRQNGTELRRIQIASIASPGPRFLDAAFGSLWVTGYGDHTMEKLDPSSGRLVSAVALAATPVGVVVGGSALYVAGADGSVARINPESDCVTALAFVGGVATDPATGDGDSIYLTPGGDAVDVGYDRGAVAILDATTLAVRKAFRVDNQDFQGGLAATTGAIWYPTFGDNSVLEVKP